MREGMFVETCAAVTTESAMTVRRIVIVGGGTAGWMTAASLGWALSALPIEIVLVESEEIGTVGVGEATVPHIRFFNQRLGIDEADFMRRTNATFKLGIEFRDWARIGDSYIHPFGNFGRDIAGLPFHQHWLRLARTGRTRAELEAFSLPILAARADRFAPPSPDQTMIESTFSYAYQFDASLYAAYLRSYAEERGVRRVEGKVLSVEQDGESGFIQSVRLENGENLAGDLFVDCSGFRGLLIEGALKAGYETWTHWLPCDAALAVPCAQGGPLTPYTRATARDAGWQWRIPLQHRVGNGHVFSTAFTDVDSARDILMANLEGAALADPKLLRFVTGKRKTQWLGNVVAIGLSSGFLEPLESTSIHLIQLAITKLIDLLPLDGWDPLDAAEFNRSMVVEYERVRDFLILHYCATERTDTAFWNHCRTMSLPDSLAYKMAAFRERGVVVKYREGMFLEPSWLAVYYGQRVEPDRVNPLVEALPIDEVAARAAAMAIAFRRAADAMPDHAEYLRRLCAAAEPVTA
jgi:tryptophan halogenase